MTKKLILIGPKTGIKGGVNVSFNLLLDELNRREIPYTCIDMPSGNYVFRRYLMIVVYLIKILRNVERNCVIALFASTNTAIAYTILLDVVAKKTNSTLIVRVFGGGHFNKLDQKPAFLKKRVLECYKRHILLLEIKRTVKKAKEELGLINTKWFPTSRLGTLPKQNESFRDSEPLQILYLSQVRWNKGIDRCISLANYIQKKRLNAKIHVYGELFEEKYLKEIKNISNDIIQYHGVANREEVYDIMRESDIFFFPTRYDGEGYPGVIVESITVSLPIFATDMENIRDLIEHEKDGLLVNFDDEERVWNQMEYLILNRDRLREFHQNLSQKEDQFSSEYWNGEFFLELVEGGDRLK